MNNKEIGARIKISRIEQHLTLKEVADKIGLASSTIQRYETGQIKKVKLPVIEAIANALNINSSWIIGKSESKTKTDTTEHSAYIEYIIDEAKQLNQKGQIKVLEFAKDLVGNINYQEEPDYMKVVAAHQKEDATQEDIEHDNKLMEEARKLKK